MNKEIRRLEKKSKRNILKRKKIQIFNFGNHERSFTYIDDIVEGIISLIDKIPNNSLQKNSDKIYHTDWNLSKNLKREYLDYFSIIIIYFDINII
jgi:UDP-glucuronate 4-epimerase